MKKKLKETKNIPLIDNEEERLEFPEESIEQFIKYVEHQTIPLSKENIIYLSYLAQKYGVSSLIESTKEFLDQHHDKLTLQILLVCQEKPEFDTSSYEDTISNHMKDYIKDDKIFQLNFQILYRIFHKYQQMNKKEKIDNKEINEFLFKCLDRFGRKASILFENVDVRHFGHENFNRLLTDYSKSFDFHFINSFYLKTL